MRLSITTPLSKVIEAEGITYLRAEDETGAFGILPGHADFLTTLTVSVVTWRANGKEHHVAVRGGVLTIEGGGRISIITREAIGEDTLSELGDAVLTRLRHEEENEEVSRQASTRMEVAVMRQIERYLATTGDRLRGPRAGPEVAERRGSFVQGTSE